MIEIRHKQTKAIVFRHKGELAGADLRRADLRGANLRSEDLSDANLTGSCLAEADLRGATLAGAILDQCDLKGSRLTKARLSGAQLREADLRGASLPDYIWSADFSFANMRDTDLRGVTFAECLFRYTDICGAGMRGPGKLLREALVVLALITCFFVLHTLAQVTRGLDISDMFLAVIFGLIEGIIGGLTNTVLGTSFPPPTTLTECDFTGTIHDATTRWPKGFAPPSPRGD